ncbi:MAG: hypothetical protein U0946_04930, partial [Patescibacteria group bacterium]|nr:hypothetical protein [Patescibacteria group bacterium]
IKLFAIKNIHQTNAIFDLQKLNYFNAKLIRQTKPKALLQLIKTFLKFKLADEKLMQILPLVQERLVKLTDINDLIDFFIVEPQPEQKLILAQSKLPASVVKDFLQTVIDSFSQISHQNWQLKNLEVAGHDLLAQIGLTPRQLFMTIRVLVTGKTATPPLFDLMAILGKQTTLKRLIYAQKNI